MVLCGPVYGASALIRGLAALPLLPVMPDSGALQVVALENVAETAAFLIRPEAGARLTLVLADPARLAFAEVVAQLRPARERSACDRRSRPVDGGDGDLSAEPVRGAGPAPGLGSGPLVRAALCPSSRC